LSTGFSRAGGAADFACQLSVALTAWPMGCATGAGMALPADQREALRILAGSPAGSTESLMLAHGFGIGTLHDLVRNGHATSERRIVRGGKRLVRVNWMTITDAGRRVLAL
jgi:hypothetical protein